MFHSWLIAEKLLNQATVTRLVVFFIPAEERFRSHYEKLQTMG